MVYMVSTLVGSVLLALSEDQRSRCDCEAIVAALEDLTGSDTVQDLRDMVEEDPDSVKTGHCSDRSTDCV